MIQTRSSRRLYVGLLALLGIASGFGCVAPVAERLTCDDTLSPAQFKTSDLETLIAGTSGKGCAAEGCHDGATREEGFRLDSSVYIYEELSTRADILYAMIASGEMPAGDGTRWDQDDLRLFRSWYCNGGFPQ
ncbi:MAG: hypothetical protein ABI895_22830 [Deltaproteobacteria bacterium]